jgi:superfamily I DNA/RNA helicase
METNYRSGSAIVEAGERLIAFNGDRQLPKQCKAYYGRGEGGIRSADTGDHAQTAEYFGQEIAKRVEDGDSPQDFGLVTRTNAEKDAFMMALLSRGIPFRSNGGGYFEKPAVGAVLAWLNIALSEDRNVLNKAMATALDSKLPAFFLGGAFFESLRAVAGSRDYVTALLYDADKLPSRLQRNTQRLADFVRALRKKAGSGATTSELLTDLIENMPGADGQSLLQKLARSINPDDLLAEGVELDKEGKVPESVLFAAAGAVLDPLRGLANASPANDANPHAYLDVLNTLREANKKPAPGEVPPPSVQIDTCHQWKGLEAKKVFVLMNGNVWPPKPRPPEPGQETAGEEALQALEDRLAEERRLAYVAITRGKDQVTVLDPATDYMGREVPNASIFLYEMGLDADLQDQDDE